MTVGKAIFYLLNNYSNLTNIVGTRIYPEVAEQDGASPFVVYTIISNSPSDTHSGPSQLDVAQVDVVAYSTSYSECIDIGVHVRAALDRVTGTYNGVNVQSCQYTTELIDFDDYRRSYVITQSYDVRISRTEFEIAQGTPVTGALLGDLYDVTDNATTGQVMIKQANGTWSAGDQGSGTGGVDSVNGLNGDVTIAAGSNVTVSTAGQTITISSSGGSGGGNKFDDIDGVTADSGSSAVDLIASTGISITPDNVAKTITFAVSGLDTDDITEAANLYYTDARADARIANASVTDLTDVTSAGSGAIITTAERTKLEGIAAGAQRNVATDLTHTANGTTVTIESSTGSDTVIAAASVSAAGVMTANDRTKLDGIATGAEVNVNADWDAVSGDAQILNKPTLATVATTGAYSDLSGTPTLATVATTGAYSDLTGTPTLATVATTGAYGDLSGTPTIPAQFFAVSSNAGTSITLNTGDEGTYIRCTASSAVTITVPADKFQVDDEIIIEQAGTGQVEITAGASVTLNNSATNTAKTAERYAVVALKCVASNTFTLTGERELA